MRQKVGEGSPCRGQMREVSRVHQKATRDNVGSAAAPAAKCKSLRRGSFISNLPSHHSITSSAATSSLSGTVRPSVLTLLRLITSSPQLE